MIRALLPLLLLPAILPAQEPALTTSGRLQLHVPAEAPPLRDVRVSKGQAGPAAWLEDPVQRERLTDVTFPIQWWRWQELTLNFTPAHDGEVELMLGGAWKEASPGVLERQEIHWDDLSAEGTELANGGFETPGEGAPAGWNSPWHPYPSSSDWPLDTGSPRGGKSLAASWHNRPLTQKLKVTAGKPITLKLHARAVTPPGFKTPKKQAADTPAHHANAKLKRGVNLGNCWEAPPGGGWKIQYTADDIDLIATQGFDHIRVPVAWHHFIENGAIRTSHLDELQPVLKRAREKNLRILLNWHHFDDLCRQPETHRAAFAAGWKLVSRHFKDWPDTLIFELLNEPHDKLDGDIMGSIYRDAIDVIRATNPQRTIMVNPSHWATVGALDRLVLPDDDDRIIVSIHCYEPFQFTHQDAGWANLTGLRGIVYPGPPSTPLSLPDSFKDRADIVAWVEAYNTRRGETNPCSAAVIGRLLDDAVAWSQHYGRPIHLGEFGAYRVADDQSRERYAADVRRAAEKRNLPWAMWDWKAGFAYWDAQAGKPLLREALFGAP